MQWITLLKLKESDTQHWLPSCLTRPSRFTPKKFTLLCFYRFSLYTNSNSCCQSVCCGISYIYVSFSEGCHFSFQRQNSHTSEMVCRANELLSINCIQTRQTSFTYSCLLSHAFFPPEKSIAIIWSHMWHYTESIYLARVKSAG